MVWEAWMWDLVEESYVICRFYLSKVIQTPLSSSQQHRAVFFCIARCRRGGEQARFTDTAQVPFLPLAKWVGTRISVFFELGTRPENWDFLPNAREDPAWQAFAKKNSKKNLFPVRLLTHSAIIFAWLVLNRHLSVISAKHIKSTPRDTSYDSRYSRPQSSFQANYSSYFTTL